MKIGVMIGLKKDTDIHAELAKVRDMHLQSCQISVWDMSLYSDETAKEIVAACEETGITVSTLWAGWSGPKEWNFTYGPQTLGLVPPAYRGVRLADLLRSIPFAKAIGTKNIATHVGFLPDNPADPDYNGTIGTLRHLVKAMKEEGLNFLFETGQETPVTILRAIEDIGCDNVGVNFDTANVILYGKANAVDALRVFGKYVRDLHIKDGLYPTDGRNLGKEVPAGEGLANFPEILKMLKGLGYDGPFTIEREIKGEKQTQDIIRARDLLLEIEKTL